MIKHLAALTLSLGLGATISGCTTDQLAQTANIIGTHFQTVGNTGLTQTQIQDGLKQALKIGTQNVTDKLGATNGFLLNEEIRIPLPQNLQKAKNLMTMAGFGDLANEVELKLNRAAEASMPVAQASFLSAIDGLTLTDALDILKGGDTAATDYFKEQMTPMLLTEITPIVTKKLNEVGALQTYNAFMDKYKNMPLISSMMPNLQQDLTSYAVEETIAGAFTYLAREEQLIRQDPAARTTHLLQKVFAQQ